jgi:uncharacterized protein
MFVIKFIKNVFSDIFLGLILFYQKTLSPDHGWLKSYWPHGYCRFYPTCSTYTFKSIQKHGPFKGLILGIWRIFRCNPFNHGGHDPVK